ncbi:MAG: ABC transporter substrate-binding protein, partial [Mariprofundaceae bacterium]
GIVELLEGRANKDLLTENDRIAIRTIVDGKFDYREMSRRSLGKKWAKKWKTINTAKQNELTDAFRELLERSYGNRLAKYDGQKIQFYDASFSKSGKAKVKSEVIDSNKKTPIEYRLHKTAIGWQVYDIKPEGVSLVSNFRKQFKSILKDGGFDHLIEDLQKKVASLKEKKDKG